MFLTPLFLLHVSDMDTSPKKRREVPEFYGYIPATGRGLIFFLMMVNSTAQFLAKIMSMALLGAVSKTWAFGYIVGDIVLFLLYTLVRNDFFFFIPIQSYIWSIGVSLLIRIINKVSKGAVEVTFYIYSLTDLFTCNTITGCHRLHSFDTHEERF